MVNQISTFLMCIHFISCEAAQNAKWLDKDKVNDGSNGVQQSTENLPVSSQSTPTATKRKKKNTILQDEIPKRFDALSQRMDEEEIIMKKVEEEMVKVEKRGTDILQQFVEYLREMKNACIAYMNNCV